MLSVSLAALSSAVRLATLCCVGLSFAENHAVQLDGENGRINLDPAPIGTPFSVTVELWVRLDAGDRTQFLVSNSFNEFSEGFTLWVTSDNQVAFFAGTFGASGTALGSTKLEPGRWYHVAGLYDGWNGKVKVFVDGVEEGVVNYRRGIWYAYNRDLLVGMQNQSVGRSGTYLEGTVDELRIWNVVRTAEQIEAARWGELEESVRGLLGYWPLNEGTGTNTRDYSQGKTGVLEGGAQWTAGDWAGGLEVTIDIRPDDADNVINIRSRGVIPVALLSTANMDVTDIVDRKSLTFGHTGEEASLHTRGYGTPNCGVEDVNADGLDDLVCKFKTPDTGFTVNDDEGILNGLTLSGDAFTGRDWVRISMPRRKALGQQR